MFDGLAEGVERGDDVLAIEPEVESEVVAGTGRHAHEGHVVGVRDVGNQGLRSVATRHPDDVHTVCHGLLGERRRSSPGCSTTG